jgi:hypothetical protein
VVLEDVRAGGNITATQHMEANGDASAEVSPSTQANIPIGAGSSATSTSTMPQGRPDAG